ncbi:MAG: DUF2190 family protein [Candidatus Kapabacteria bacterium]|nr:DUF2190 family protein [Ignavibacteriota bacterium]MCW5885038.1 DUF2190 family protein [Candidatus Kapabacteria bacterium]
MSANNKTYHPLNYITIEADEDLLPNRFVDFNGGVCASESKSLGVTDSKWLSGEQASIITIGIAVVESSVAIDAGDLLTSDTDGKAKKATGIMQVNGRSLDTITGAGFVRVILIHS